MARESRGLKGKRRRTPRRAPVARGFTLLEVMIALTLFATLAAIVDHALPAGVAEDSHDLLPVWKQNAPSPRRSIVHNTMARTSSSLGAHRQQDRSPQQSPCLVR